MIVAILLIEHLFEQKFRLRFEITHNLIVVTRRDKLFELVEDVDASPGVVSVLCVFKVLYLHEKLQELIKALNYIDVNLEESLECLMALSEFVHGSEVKGVPS